MTYWLPFVVWQVCGVSSHKRNYFQLFFFTLHLPTKTQSHSTFGKTMTLDNRASLQILCVLDTLLKTRYATTWQTYLLYNTFYSVIFLFACVFCSPSFCFSICRSFLSRSSSSHLTPKHYGCITTASPISSTLLFGSALYNSGCPNRYSPPLYINSIVQLVLLQYKTWSLYF